MKKYLYSLAVGMTVLGVAGVGVHTAGAHGFVPHILDQGVTQVTSNSAVFTATIDSMHSSTNGHAWFEYGTNPFSGDYGTSWPFKAGIQGIPRIGQTHMSVSVSNLRPNTTYYVRVKAENKNGNNPGKILTFRTSSSQTICSPWCNSNNWQTTTSSNSNSNTTSNSSSNNTMMNTSTNSSGVYMWQP